jgi:putative oxidoreductase
MSYGLLLIRVVVGLTLAAHGVQKVPGWLGGYGPKGTAGFFASVGFRQPLVLAVLAGLLEAGGGLAFAAGFLTPAAALAIVIVMLMAIGSVHLRNGFFVSNGGYEFNLTLIAAVTGVAAIGPGRFALDRAIGWDDNLSGLWWGVGVLGVGLAIALLNFALLWTKPAPAEPQVIADEAPVAT